MKIVFENQEYECCGILSSKDFTGRDLSSMNISNKVIYGSCFSQEQLDRHCFPENMTGVTFINCNLDNCYIPEGNTILGKQPRRFQLQEDGFDWILDKNNNPVEKL